MEEVKIFVNKFKNLLLILVCIIAVFILLVWKAVPAVHSTIQVFKDYSTTQKTISEKSLLLDELLAKEREQQNSGQLKEFYKPIGQATDTESVIANEFAEILMLMKAHSIKTYSIQYTYDPEDDNFVKNVPEHYSVAKLDLQMIANYKNFKDLLKELYKHEHFLDIVSVDVKPYNNNKKILIMNLQLKLYAQKN